MNIHFWQAEAPGLRVQVLYGRVNDSAREIKNYRHVSEFRQQVVAIFIFLALRFSITI
jgi:hypothetical protein